MFGSSRISFVVFFLCLGGGNLDSEIKLIADTWDKISPEFDDMHNTEDLKLWKQNLKMLLGDNKE
jgi:hypothetical protein